MERLVTEIVSPLGANIAFHMRYSNSMIREPSTPRAQLVHIRTLPNILLSLNTKASQPHVLMAKNADVEAAP